MFKKVLSVFMALAMVLSMFCGCSAPKRVESSPNVTANDEEYADTVVYGTIWTAEDNDTVEAFAVKNDKFIYVGDKEGASSYVKEGVTKVIDNTGKGLIIPACTEGHGHFVGIDALVRMLPGYFVEYDEVLKILAESMKQDPKPESFLSWGWTHTKFMENIDTSKSYAEEIEKIAPGIPVVLIDTSGHNAMCNVTALKKAGVYNGEKVRGGAVTLTDSGVPNGLIDDEIVPYVIERVIDFDKIDQEVYLAACKNAIDTLHKRGFTNYYDAYINYLSDKPFYKYINELDNKDELNVNIATCFTVRSYNDKEYKEKIDYVVEMGDKYHSKHFDPYNIKLFADGVVESGTGWMIDEYPNASKGKEHGNIVWQPEELNELVKYANGKDILVHTHAYGDGAVKAMLDAYINSNNSHGKKFPNSLGHVRNITKEDIDRASKNGIGIAENLIWHASDIPYDENYDATMKKADKIFPKRVFESGYPMKSLMDAGIVVSSSTDAPAAETLEGNIMNILSVATTGLTPDKDNTIPYNTSELLTVREALKCLTINGATNMGIADKTGSIKVGKNADFVILDTNFLDYKGSDLMKIHNTKINDVYFEGKNVFSTNKNSLSTSNYKLIEKQYASTDGTGFTDMGDYLIWLDDFKSADYESALRYADIVSNSVKGLCTTCVKKNSAGEVIIGRNNDMEISQCPGFIFTTSYGKYKTLNMRYVSAELYTYKQFVENGYKDKEYINLIGLASPDAINSEGLFVQANAREQGDNFYNTGTNPGKKRARVDMLPCLITQNCATVKEAVEYVKNELDVYSTPKKGGSGFTELAYLMGDATGEYGLLEIAGNNIYFLPYQNGQANYYLNPICNSIDKCGSGYGRLERLMDGLNEVDNQDDMLKHMQKAMWRDAILYANNTYLDEEGEIHFVDDSGNPVEDWRSDIYPSTMEKVYGKESLSWFAKSVRENMSPDNCINFIKCKDAFVKNGYKEMLLEYYNGNEKPLRDCGDVWTTGLQLSVNCKNKNVIARFFEKENLTFELNCNKILN